MSLPTAQLEPAPRDPKKLRNTAFVLVALMIVGGAVIYKAYEKHTAESARDDRPAFIGRLTEEKDLPVLRQDASRAGIFTLAGKVNLIQCLSASQPETATLSTEVMKRLAARYAANPDFALITLVIDPGTPETLSPLLAATAEKLDARLPRWWVASTEPSLLHKYVKKEFKASLLPHQADGKWIYDTSLVLIDRNRHIRRAVVPQKRGGPAFTAIFDFDQAAKWDAEGIKTGTDLTNAGQLEALLIETIDELLAETVRKS